MIAELVPPHVRTGDMAEDLIAAIKEAHRRSRTAIRLGGMAIEELNLSEGYSWRSIERHTGIPVSTARRWVTLSHENTP